MPGYTRSPRPASSPSRSSFPSRGGASGRNRGLSRGGSRPAAPAAKSDLEIGLDAAAA